MIVRRKQIRDICGQLLATHGVQHAPVDVEKIAKERGALVHKDSVQDKVSGFLFRDNRSGTAVIGVNRNEHPNRQRFTIAHELAHFVLHTGDGVHVDHGFVVKHRDDHSSEGVDIEEVEANLFAAELLMPLQFLRDDVLELGDLDILDEQQISRLAKKYQVSSQAMAIRLSHLGFLPF